MQTMFKNECLVTTEEQFGLANDNPNQTREEIDLHPLRWNVSVTVSDKSRRIERESVGPDVSPSAALFGEASVD